jgi:hypothetical protein
VLTDEGLLKKRIDEAYTEIIKHSGDINWTKWMRDSAKTIWDEAKQDFPMKIQVMANKPSFHDFYDPLEVDAWLKKWCGERKK